VPATVLDTKALLEVVPYSASAAIGISVVSRSGSRWRAVVQRTARGWRATGFDQPGTWYPMASHTATDRRLMPAKDEETPSTLERSPKKVRDTYEKTLDSAHEQYGSEQRAHRTAWSAVKHVAEKKGDHWELKDEQGPSDAQDEKTGAAARRGGETAGGINAKKTKRELMDDARDADIQGRSKMDKGELVDALKKHADRETAKARR